MHVVKIVYLSLVLAMVTVFLSPVAARSDDRALSSRESAVQPDDVPEPLPHDCIGVAPSDPDACCVYGYVYHDDVPLDGVSVHVQSASGEFITSTSGGDDSSFPYYGVDLGFVPLSVSPGDTITITASYSDMLSARTWVVQADSQQVDLGLIAGHQSPVPVSQ